MICHARHEKVLNWIEKFVIIHYVSLFDVTEVYSMFSLFGPDVERVLPLAGRTPSESRISNPFLEVKVGHLDIVVGSSEPISI
jgi:hypothetical protein